MQSYEQLGHVNVLNPGLLAARLAYATYANSHLHPHTGRHHEVENGRLLVGQQAAICMQRIIDPGWHKNEKRGSELDARGVYL